MRSFEDLKQAEDFDLSGIETSYFLLGLLSAYDNRYQAKADTFFGEISWKQFFALICLSLCKENPTLKELAEIMGSSHQNVKQILNKLEKKGFVETVPDIHDKRKQRIVLTEKTRIFCAEHDEQSERIVSKIFEGIDQNDIGVTIKTIMQMEKNLESI